MEQRKIQECCQFVTDGDHLPPPKSKKGIPFITITNINEFNKILFDDVMYVPESYFSELSHTKKAQKGDILYSVVGSFGKPVFITNNKKFVFQRHIALLRPNDTINGKYLYYSMLNPSFFKVVDKYAIGCSQRTVTLDTLRNLKINIPSRTIQDNIAGILSLLDEKIDKNNVINDNLQQELCLIYEHIMSQAKKGLILGTHAIASELSEITTGREDANFADTNGKYKFFTCSSETLKCNHYAFNSSSILIAGNGEFNVKHFSGKFNAYQRTYVLTPKQEHYGLLYLACLYQIKSFKSSSAGSIVKFITKGDIDNIPVFIPDDGTYLIQMNKLLDLQEMRLQENEKLLALRDFLLPLLMNGQATIAE